MPDPVAEPRTPIRAWVVVFAGTAVNLCLGILYAWSIWKANLVGTAQHPAGTAMGGLNEGWIYLTDAQATWAYAICGITFALFMIPGGLLQDKLGPRIGATLGGLFLGGGCILAGLGRSYWTLLAGFGVLGGIGMGLGYAAATPAAVKWFGPHRRGLVAGLVVGGYGAAAIYISPTAKHLIANYGISGSFITLGIFFAIVIVTAAQLLANPGSDYRPAACQCIGRQCEFRRPFDGRRTMVRAVDARHLAVLCDVVPVCCVGAIGFARDRQRCANSQPDRPGRRLFSSKRLVAGIVRRLC